MDWKTIGVLGGLGPQATIDFYNTVLTYCQKKFQMQMNEGYPKMIIFNCNFPPFDEKNNKKVNPKLIEAAKSLERAGAEFLVIPSNTPHIFYQDIKNSVDIPILSIIDETIKAIKDRKIQKVGLLATTMTIESSVYQSQLAKSDIETIVLDNEMQARIEKVIFEVMEGKLSTEMKAIIDEAVEKLQNQGAEIIILGCTEIPVLLGNDARKPIFVDTTSVIAEAAVNNAVVK